MTAWDYAQYFFLYGFVSWLGTALMQAIVQLQSRRAWPLEVIQTLFLLTVLERVVTHPDFWTKFAVATGGATGTVVAIEWRKWQEKRKNAQQE